MINNDVEGDIINVYLEVDAHKEMNLEKKRTVSSQRCDESDVVCWNESDDYLPIIILI